MVLKLTGGRCKIVFKPLPQDDPTQRQPELRSPGARSDGNLGAVAGRFRTHHSLF
jgi:hypothetical protein